MFFIGPSTNIFVYLLVSAFFVICFYSQNETKLPDALPGYETVATYKVNENEVYYSYRTTEKKDTASKKELPRVSVKNDPSNIRRYTCFIYKDPNLSITALRAPPVV
ncbi:MULTISPECIES: hypothetical protein [Odoribacteraceae]|uniref:hypothetical protein n=1 Tax=Odoribacteraceae TaxID=1853231 RepID=UPI000E536C1C|nr:MULTISPECIES: hypothetical protein [Odoribacteraceae]MCQ4874960.1 hypothetical protein [Butyricimonas paravirosa]RHR82982.1 hypothetical protein DWW52_03770 [Odoribacter sp. AF15-53]